MWWDLSVGAEDIIRHLSAAGENREAESLAQTFKCVRLERTFVDDDSQRLSREDKLKGESGQVEESTLIREENLLLVNAALQHLLSV